MERRSQKQYAKAGTEDEDGNIYKHKWMRWRTFNRLVDRADALSGEADARFLYRLRRFGFNFDAIAAEALGESGGEGNDATLVASASPR
jgi:hypothetical protein